MNSTSGTNTTVCDMQNLYGLSLEQYNSIWNCLYVVMFVPTVFGNSLIVLSILRFRHLRTKIHILIGNLALSDFLFGAVLIPLDSIGTALTYNTSKYFCLTRLSFFTLSLGGSCFNLLLISIERFLSVVFPMRHSNFTRRKLLLVIGFGWVYVGIQAMMPLAGCNKWKDGSTNSECNASVLWGDFCKTFMNWNFVISMLLNIILFSAVIRIALKKAKSSVQPEARSTWREHRDKNKTRTMAFVLGLFALFWSPYAFMTLLISIVSKNMCIDVLFFIRRWCLLLGVCNSGINWIIYGFRNREFRDAFKALIKCKAGSHRVLPSLHNAVDSQI